MKQSFWQKLFAALTSPTAIKLYEVGATVAVGTFVKNPHSKEIADSILNSVQSAQNGQLPPVQ